MPLAKQLEVKQTFTSKSRNPNLCTLPYALWGRLL